jgi:hypothetical protein
MRELADISSRPANMPSLSCEIPARSRASFSLDVNIQMPAVLKLTIVLDFSKPIPKIFVVPAMRNLFRRYNDSTAVQRGFSLNKERTAENQALIVMGRGFESNTHQTI